MDLTLCLIIKNEEANLADCLRSFAGLYKKIVIIDTGSTDRSKEIAASSGAEVHDFKWVDDFSAARNFALSRVNSEWVMVVDADDRIDPKAKSKLIADLENIRSNVKGIFLPYNYSGAKSTNKIMAYLPRIWRTKFNYSYTMPVHEYLNVPAEDVRSFIKLQHTIVHAKDQGLIIPSRLRNLRILENAYKIMKNNNRILFYLGSENFYTGNYAQAIKWLDKLIAGKLTKNRDELNRVYLFKGQACQKIGQLVQARNAYKRAIAESPDLIEPYLLLGDLEMERKKYDKAVFAYVSALKCKLPVTHVFVNAALYNGAAQKKIHEALMQLEKNR